MKKMFNKMSNTVKAMTCKAHCAMTRARTLLIVVGDDQVLARMAANDRQQRRYSGLRARLARTAEPAEPAPEQLQL